MYMFLQKKNQFSLDNEQIVEWLIQNGAKVNSLTNSKSTPLLGSAIQGYYNN